MPRLARSAAKPLLSQMCERRCEQEVNECPSILSTSLGTQRGMRE